MTKGNSKKLSGLMKIITVISCLLIIAVHFYPIWRIELSAPQYPEGLVLEIWTNKLGGNVDIVSGLNHYIGMRPLKTEDFPEFKILPWIMITLAGIGVIVLLTNKKLIYNIWFYIFIAISIISMIDFYKWEYDYGHELNPEAPIQVPGMAYQPPLIGYKKLLNFGAYSIPDKGGWLFIGAGLLLLTGWIIGRRVKEFNNDKISL
jgi:copper chaperone NosL